jgi:hypothetical protein
MRVWHFTGLAFLGLASSAAALAQTSEQAPLSCGLYARLDRVCNCPESTNYLRSYGLKYCKRFRQATGWTPAGTLWRNLTLVCLQNELIRLSPKYIPNCDCKGLQEAAFGTHAFCYTQHPSSFCTLPVHDVNEIYGIIDSVDFQTSLGFQQGIAIFWDCLTGQFPSR